jgi:hypothetical protein
MSALGHKQTFAVQKGMSALRRIATRESAFAQKVMSALLPKADMCSALAHVRFGPKADIPAAKDFDYCNPAKSGHNWLPRLTVTTVNQANNKTVPNAVMRIISHMQLLDHFKTTRRSIPSDQQTGP